MRVLLVTLSDILPFALTQVLNPELEYCAIVVDEPSVSKKMFENIPQFQDRIFPFYELKECIQNFYYDFLLHVHPHYNDMSKKFKEYGLPKNKLVSLTMVHTPDNFLLERALKYYSEHVSEFEMFATGMSYTEYGLDTNKFKRKLFNFGNTSQDLYYDYKIAKRVIAIRGGGYIKYALIGISPYSFHYDQTKGSNEIFRLLQYAIAFNDLHNFWLPIEQYKKIFRPEYLNYKIQDNSPMSCIRPLPTAVNRIGIHQRIGARERIDMWRDKNFPDTKVEYSKILDEYLTLCEKNNVTPIMISPPVTEGYKKYFRKKILDEFYCIVRETQKKHNTAIFFDGWSLPIFSDADFWDVDHLNIQGAAKFSSALNNFIERLS